MTEKKRKSPRKRRCTCARDKEKSTRRLAMETTAQHAAVRPLR